MITVVTSPGFIRTVSFQPISLASGELAGPMYGYMHELGSPVNGCRWMIWTLTRWKWMGWVSPVRLIDLPDFDRPGCWVSPWLDRYKPAPR